MLSFLGLRTLEELYSAIPEALRLGAELELLDGLPAEGLSETEVMAWMDGYARANIPVGRSSVCFAGGGAYDRGAPSATRSLAQRSEFVTSYTPYQPEVAQGVLQALFEYQTTVTALTGLDISNASLYDGASALVEAIRLAVAVTGRTAVLCSQGVHPAWRDVACTALPAASISLEMLPLRDGATAWPTGYGDAGGVPGERPGAIVVSYPNYLGCLEDIAAARRLADETLAILIVCFDPVAMGILRSPGSWGADVAVGEGQPLGMPLSFGGPYLGLFATRMDLARKLPGRLVGKTEDIDGRPAFVMTLRAREQDIRRERATSNVCTNQTLMAITAAIQLGWLGPGGLAEIARRSAVAAHYCRDELCALDGVRPLVGAPFFDEFAITLPIPAQIVIDRMLEEGYLAGIQVPPELNTGSDKGLLIAVTERRTLAEIDGFVAALAKVIC